MTVYTTAAFPTRTQPSSGTSAVSAPRTEAEIREKLKTDQAWIERALVVLLRRQTDDEQAMQTTRYRNHRGFSAPDAFILTSFAKQINRGYHLSPKQLAIAKKRVFRYSGQLMEEAKEKAIREAIQH